MRVIIQDVSIEVKKPGPKGYSLATVTYTANGATRKQNVMSFVNPAVYKAVQALVGQEADVTVTKNAKDYDEWAAIAAVTAGSPAPAPSAAATAGTTRVTGSNYETPLERAKRQVLIVRQSSLTAALKFVELTPNRDGSHWNEAGVMELAQTFTDWVFDNEEEGFEDVPV